MNRAPYLVAGLAATVAVGTTAPLWVGVFAASWVSVVVLAAVAAGAAIGVGAHRFGWAASLAAGTVVVALAVAIGHPRDLATLGLLMAPTARLLAIPVGVGLVGAWWASMALVPRHPGTSGVSPLVAAVPVAAAHAVASAYTVGQRPLSTTAALATVGALLIGALVARGTVAIRWRATAAVGIGAMLAAAGGLAVGDDDPFDLRRRLNPPVEVVESTSPLSLVKSGLVETNPSPVFTISVEGLGPDSQIELIPVALLDVYDGAVWTSSGRFVPAGQRLPALPDQSLSSDQVVVDVQTTGQYPFDTLPMPGTLRTIEDGDLLWDQRSGAILAEGAEPVRYRGEVLLSGVERTMEGEPGGVGGYLHYPGELSTESIDGFITTRLTGDDQRAWLDQLEANLRGPEFGYSETAPGGHGMAALSQYLDGGDDGISRGFAEHSASSFAVMARRLNIPSRVVVGYRPTEPITAANGEVTVTEDEIDAWPEVWINGVGWMAFDPTNRENLVPDSSQRPPSATDSPDAQAGAEQGPETEAPEPPPLTEPDVLPDPEPQTSTWTRLLMVIVVLAVLYLIGVPLYKALRRRRRRRIGDESTRVIAAWREAEDRLIDAGRHPHPDGTVIDLRDRILVTDGAPPSDGAEAVEPVGARRAASALDDLSVEVDRALYAPEGAAAGDAELAWQASDQALGAMRQDWGPSDRLKESLNPRSLFPRR